MEKTNKRILGFSVIAALAVAITLMFSLFANAAPTATTQETQNDTVKFTMTTANDPFGNQMTEYYVDDAKEASPSVSLDIEKGYCWQYTYEDDVIKIYDKATPTETGAKVVHTIYAVVTDSRVFEHESILFFNGVGAARKQLQDADTATITDAVTFDTTADNAEYDSYFSSLSPIFSGALPRLGYYTLNVSGTGSKYWDLTSNIFYGSDNLDNTKYNKSYQYLRNLGANDFSVHGGASISMDESNYQIHIKDYAQSDPTKTLYDITLTFNTFVGGFEVYDFSTVNQKTGREIGDTILSNTLTEATMVSQEISIGGIKYSVITMDAVKYIITKIRVANDNGLGIDLPEGWEQIITALPSSVAVVTGLEDDCPADIEIPNFISTEAITGYTFPVMGVYDMNSTNLRSIKFNYNMKFVYDGCCAYCKNLESITYSDSGLAFIPNIETTLEYRTACNEAEEDYDHGTITYEQYQAILEELESDYKEDLQEMHAFPYAQIASVYIPEGISPSETMMLVIANDNTYCTWGFSPKNIKIVQSIGGLRGVYERADEVKFVDSPKTKVMVAKGSFSAQFVNKVTQQPVIGAKVYYSDELGIEHVAYTNQMGVFTFDDLYQTAGLLKYEKQATQIIDFHPRKISVTCDGYEPIYLDEEKDTVNDSNLPAILKWRLGCYSYLTQWGTVSSDVVLDQPVPMTQLYTTGYLASAANMNYVLDVAAGSKLDGANVQVYQSNQTDAQKFEFVPGTDDQGMHYLTIYNANSGKVLDVSGGVAENYRNVQQYEPNDSLAQRWYPEKRGDYYVFHSAIDDSYVLDLNAGFATNGQNIQLYKDNDSTAQKFLYLESTPAVPGGDFDLKDGYYVIRTAIDNCDNVLDVQWGSSDDGADVWAYKYAKGNTNQVWHVEQIDFGYYKLTNVNTGKVLDVSGCGIIPGTNVWQYSDNGTAAQQWAISKVNVGNATYYKLVNAGTGLTLDLAGAGTESGTNVQGYYDNGSVAQMWDFHEVDPSTF